MKLNIRPKEFALMDIREKALIIAFIDEYIKEKEKFEKDLFDYNN